MTQIPHDRRRPNAFYLNAERAMHAPSAHVFEVLTTRIPDLYPLLSPGHERYEVRGGGPLAEGALIDCAERAGEQRVEHTYVVKALQAPSHLHLASTPSRTWVRVGERVIEGASDTDVYYDLTPSGEGTRLAMTIVIALPSLGKKLLATLGGTYGVWRRHQRGELDRLAAFTEATRPLGPLAFTGSTSGRGRPVCCDPTEMRA